MGDKIHPTHFQVPEMPYKTEKWKDIPEWNGYYQVSTFGNVRSIKKNGKLWTLKPGIKNGYFFVSLYHHYKHKDYYIHRLVAITFLNLDTTQDLEVNHKDLNKLNNRIDNLEITYPFENYHHAADNGAMGRYKRKLNAEQVKEIRILRQQGYTLKRIGNLFGISERHAGSIANKQSWKHIG